MEKQKPSYPQRYDIFDALLTVWFALYVFLTLGRDFPPPFLGAYALLLVCASLLARRVAVPQTRRAIQFLSASVLSLASASAVALTPMNSALKNWVLVVFLAWAFGSAREFMAQPFGLSTVAAMEVKQLRTLFLVPAVATGLLLLAGLGLLEFWTDSMASLIALSSLLIPFALSAFFFRRVPSSVAIGLLQGSQAWQRTLGTPNLILAYFAAISLLGYLSEIVYGHNYVAWSVITVLLFLQALVITQILRWASRAASHPVRNPLVTESSLGKLLD